MTYKLNSLDDIIERAKKYGLDNSDIGMIGACWGDKFSEYYDSNPRISKEPRNAYIDRAKEYANKQTKDYMRSILTARGLP